MFKKSTVLVFIFSIFLTACGGSDSKQNTSTPPAISSSSNVSSSLVSSQSNSSITSSSFDSSSSSSQPAIISGWIGSNETQVKFDDALLGGELYRSDTSSCDWKNFMTCPGTSFTNITQTTLTDLSTNLNKGGFYRLKTNGKYANFPIFSNHTITSSSPISFKGKIWLIGYRGDVWTSIDGTSWDEVTPQATFADESNLYGFEVVSFNNQLFLFGGYRVAGERQNLIWSSTDGKTWIPTPSALSQRRHPKITIFQNKLWLIGGEEDLATGSTIYKNDVWSSVDGRSWHEETSNAGFTNTTGHALTSFNNKLWLIGTKQNGFGATATYTTDTWSSSNGIIWTHATEQPFGDTYYSSSDSPKVIQINNQLWFWGYSSPLSSTDGITWVAHNDLSYENAFLHNNQLIKFTSPTYIQKSADGVNWTIINQHLEFAGHPNLNAQIFNNQIVLKGYIDGENTSKVWLSRDGVQWQLQSETGPENGFAMVAFNNKLWQLGKYDSTEKRWKNEVWSSTDGTHWTLETANAAFPARAGANAISFDNKLWVIGGYDVAKFSGIDYLADVWSSTDGVNWIKQTNDAGFPGRTRAQLISFNNKLWLIGGNNGNGSQSANGMKKLNDVWSSNNGVNWQLETAHADFYQRSDHQAFVMNDKLWVLGGTSSTPNDFRGVTNDIWSSNNGISWVKEKSELPFNARPIVNFKNQLLLIGDGNPFQGHANGVWRSINGIDWQKGFYNSITTEQ